MEKTLEQIRKETGKVPPEQSMKDELELKERLGDLEYSRQLIAYGLKKQKEHGRIP